MKRRYLFFAPLILFFVLLFTDCKKPNLPYIPPSTNPVEKPTILFYQITLDGEQLERVVGKEGASNYWSDGLAQQAITAKFTTGIKAGRSAESFQFSKGVLSITSKDSTVTIKRLKSAAFFQTGTYVYAPLGSTDGIILRLVDENGVEWSTNNGSGDQTGSSFAISENSPSDTFSPLGTTITANFSCFLYNKAGQSRKIANGKLRMAIWF